MAVDNTTYDIFVQVNASDPTTSCKQGRDTLNSIQTIPFISTNLSTYRIFMMEEDKQTGIIENRNLQSGEAIQVAVRDAASTQTFASVTSGATTSTVQLPVAEAYSIYIGADRQNLSSEYVAFTLKMPEDTGWYQKERNVAFWFRTANTSLPPNLSGYENFEVIVKDDENPATKLATAINSLTNCNAAQVTNSFGGANGLINVSPAITGSVTRDPLVSNTAKIGIERTTLGKDSYYGQSFTIDMTANISAIQTALGSNASIDGKFVIKLVNTGVSPTRVKTLAIQDCKIYSNHGF